MTTTLSNETRQGDVSLAYKKGELVVIETYHYWVKSTNPAANRADILNTTNLPIPYVTVSPTGMGVCTGTDCSRVDGTLLLWEVTAKFSSSLEDNTGGNHNTDPTTWVPLRETYLEPYEEVLLRDKDNKPYTNGAGLPYEAGSTSPKDNIRWDFFQIESATVTDEQIADRNNTLNDVAYKGRAKHTLLLKIKRSVVGIYFGTARRITEYSLTWKEDNWHDKLPNYGETFLYNGKIYPYRYQDDPDTIVKGPLGIKDYNHGDTMDARGGAPTADDAATVAGSVIVSGAEVFAKPCTTPKLYYLERRKFEELSFATFLRI